MLQNAGRERSRKARPDACILYVMLYLKLRRDVVAVCQLLIVVAVCIYSWLVP